MALDVDGTLLDATHRVSDRTARAVAEVRRRNVVVAIATGRPVEGIGAPAQQADWPIGSNGATVLHAESRRVIVDRDGSVEHAKLPATRINVVVGPQLEARSLGIGANGTTHPTINKATALQSLVDHLGLSPESVWALGDSANDHQMLE